MHGVILLLHHNRLSFIGQFITKLLHNSAGISPREYQRRKKAEALQENTFSDPSSYVPYAQFPIRILNLSFLSAPTAIGEQKRKKRRRGEEERWAKRRVSFRISLSLVLSLRPAREWYATRFTKIGYGCQMLLVSWQFFSSC
jgi:hypothetical protein